MMGCPASSSGVLAVSQSDSADIYFLLHAAVTALLRVRAALQRDAK